MQRRQWAQLICGALAVVLVLGLLVSLLPYKNKNSTQVRPIGFEGSFQITPNDPPMAITKTLVNSFWNPQVVLTGSFDRPLLKGEQLLFLIKYLEVQIFLEGEELFAFGTPAQRPAKMRSSGMSWAHCVLPRDVAVGESWTIVLKNPYHNNYYSAYSDFLQSLCTGDSGALARQVFSQNWAYILGGLLFLFLSLVMGILCVTLLLQRVRLDPSIPLFIGSVACISLKILLEPRYSTLLFGNTVLIMQLELLVMIGMAMFLSSYFCSFIKTRAHRAARLVLPAQLVFLFVYLALQGLGLADAYSIRTAAAVVMGGSSLVIFEAVYYEVRHNQQHEFRFLLLPGLVFAVFCALESINYGVELFDAGQIIFIGFLVLMSTQFVLAIRYMRQALLMGRRAAELERELVQSRVSIMLSQIQPHFLYNALLGIKQLCDTQPARASDALEHFSYYLRSNLNSLGEAHLIPFQKELEHVEDYLYLEKMRFEDRLNVVWQLEYQNFLLPPLTLQALVENAVRHGITQRDEGGTVTIQSALTKEGVMVTVLDDGAGFDPDGLWQDDRSHMGIENVKGRLQAQCGGFLRIQSKPGIGTKVQIVLPQKEEPT